MGLKLYDLLLEAGLPAPGMSSEAVVICARESNQAEDETRGPACSHHHDEQPSL